MLICEILGKEWRRLGNPPVFNRDEYYSLLEEVGFGTVKNEHYLYERYAGWNKKNINMSFMLFEKEVDVD